MMMICLPPQGTPPPHSSRYGPQHTQHTASTAATPHYPQGRRQTPADAPTPLKRSMLAPFGGPRPRFVGPYKILPIFYCNKGGRGGNILRNILGNKGGLGGGYWYCTKMCNNAPFSVSRFFFYNTSRPIQNPTPPKKNHLQTPQKHIKIGRGVQ